MLVEDSFVVHETFALVELGVTTTDEMNGAVVSGVDVGVDVACALLMMPGGRC